VAAIFRSEAAKQIISCVLWGLFYSIGDKYWLFPAAEQQAGIVLAIIFRYFLP